MATIAELLALSRSAHQRYRESVPRRITHGDNTMAVAGDATLARAALLDAQRLRLEAHTQDPAHADPAWADEPPFLHNELIAFYGAVLA